MKEMFVVASNMSSFDKRFPVFLKGIPDNKKSKFLFVVGGSDVESQTEEKGITIRYVEDSSFEYTPLIDLIKHPSIYADKIFLLYDTCGLGESFFKKVDVEMGNLQSIAVDSDSESLGWLSKDFILSKKNFILSMENCTKGECKANRGKLFKIAGRKSSFALDKKVFPKKEIYKEELSTVVLYNSLDLFRYKNTTKITDDDK